MTRFLISGLASFSTCFIAGIACVALGYAMKGWGFSV
jgi:hypothetical protein